MFGAASDRCRGPGTKSSRASDHDCTLRALYWALVKKMQEEYLEELLEMQALCSFLSCLHGPQQPEVRSLNVYRALS